jgi:hypothetical protein
VVFGSGERDGFNAMLRKLTKSTKPMCNYAW